MTAISSEAVAARRSTLWSMAVGATVLIWQYGQRLRKPYTYDEIDPWFVRAMNARGARAVALQSLADDGDVQAQAVLNTLTTSNPYGERR